MFSGELGHTLARLGLRDIVGHLLGLPSNEQAPRWARDIVSGCIDADLLDYLRRDSYFAGLSQNYDDRIFRCFTERDDRLVIRPARHGRAWIAPTHVRRSLACSGCAITSPSASTIITPRWLQAR